MADKRNIVIKVKYPSSGKVTENFTPRMVTEWNVKRILLAAGTLILILAALFYLINKAWQKNDSDNAELVVNTIEEQIKPQVDVKEVEIIKIDIPKQVVARNNSPIKRTKESNKKNKPTADITIKKAIKKQTDEKTIRGYSKVNHTVIRAVLTYDINNKESKDEVAQTVNVKRKKPTWVYYVTELKSMNNHRFYHEWLKNGVIVSKQELNISGNAWRTSSRKLLTDSAKGNWAVRLVDQQGQLLNEKIFKVE